MDALSRPGCGCFVAYRDAGGATWPAEGHAEKKGENEKGEGKDDEEEQTRGTGQENQKKEKEKAKQSL